MVSSLCSLNCIIKWAEFPCKGIERSWKIVNFSLWRHMRIWWNWNFMDIVLTTMNEGLNGWLLKFCINMHSTIFLKNNQTCSTFNENAHFCHYNFIKKSLFLSILHCVFFSHFFFIIEVYNIYTKNHFHFHFFLLNLKRLKTFFIIIIFYESIIFIFFL